MQPPMPKVLENNQQAEEDQLRQYQAKQGGGKEAQEMQRLTQSLLGQKMAGEELTGLDGQLIRAAKLRDKEFNKDGAYKQGGIGAAMGAMANVLDRRQGGKQYGRISSEIDAANKAVGLGKARDKARGIMREDEQDAQVKRAWENTLDQQELSQENTEVTQGQGQQRIGLTKAANEFTQNATKGFGTYKVRDPETGETLEGEEMEVIQRGNDLYWNGEIVDPRTIGSKIEKKGAGWKPGKAMGRNIKEYTALSDKAVHIRGLAAGFSEDVAQIQGMPTEFMNNFATMLDKNGLLNYDVIDKMAGEMGIDVEKARAGARAQRRWQSDWLKYVANPEQHALYGAALTRNEQKLFQRAQGMQPGQDSAVMEQRINHLSTVAQMHAAIQLRRGILQQKGVAPGDVKALQQAARDMGLELDKDGIPIPPYTTQEWDNELVSYYGTDAEVKKKGLSRPDDYIPEATGADTGVTTQGTNTQVGITEGDRTWTVADIEDPDIPIPVLQQLLEQ